ncbi:HNH endonuclease [Deinococcus psychrotolerans]|uniref:HNH endonuclease n=1 Tax=Deinococcus psychrotolerans TaxID=2489213 RepID=A0A3G8YIM6_9DEIO|nr:HNH endonuclease signature motif containing protein [Deinococcus psychrotolerans]AZI44117.1 HNH endonuclease [Deinococcus psychrotolerans]
MKPLLLTLALASLGVGFAYNQNAPILPDPRLSPGDVLTSDTAIICVSGYTKTVRNVPQPLKEQVYRSYGIASRESGEYEVDHIISLELGGSNSIKNLYPESYKTQPLNAHVKDSLENKLHALACGGKITMQEAQQAIASNWTTAYVKYVGPLPGGAQPIVNGNAPITHVPTLPTPAPVPISSTAQGSGTATGTTTPNADGSCPTTAPIKVSSAGIYHLPTGDGNYQRTKAKSCFTSASAAQSAGYRGIKK